MTFIHIKKRYAEDEASGAEVFVVPSMAIQAPGGKKLIPNPAGREVLEFGSLKEATDAIKRAGFDYVFEGQKTYTLQASENRPAAMPTLDYDEAAPLQEAVPKLTAQLMDKAPSVIANAAFALGELKSDSAVQPLSRLLGHEDPNIRKQVATAYAKMGEMGLAVLQEAFEGAWQQKENNAVHLRLTVMTVYLEMVEFHPDLMGDVLPLVVRALDDENWLVKAQAAQVVGRTAQMLSLKESLAPEDPL